MPGNTLVGTTVPWEPHWELLISMQGSLPASGIVEREGSTVADVHCIADRGKWDKKPLFLPACFTLSLLQIHVFTFGHLVGFII